MVSVIIPTFNEEEKILKTIDVVSVNAGGYVNEVIIVDGGSTDNTVELINKRGVILIELASPNRAKQLNIGANRATNEILYFLHADTLPPVGFDVIIQNAFNRGYLSGSFQMRFDNKNKWLNIYSKFTRYNYKICRGGDRSLFISKEAFDLIEGYPEVPIMEDYELVGKIIKLIDFIVLPQKVITSARKYEKHGILRLQLIYAVIHIFHSFGWRDNKLLRIYNKLLS